MKLTEFTTSSELDKALVKKVTKSLARALEEKGKASLVVSGGKTPITFFHLLSKQALDWSKVKVTLTDERWVDPSHNDSNEKLLNEHFLINNANRAKFIPLKNAAIDAVTGETEAEGLIEAIGKFTLVILGMGEDGHTASLFPGADKLDQALNMNSGRTAIAITPPIAPHQRMTLTLPRLLYTQQVIIHICGNRKKDVLKSAYLGKDITELPIRAILKQQIVPHSIFWAEHVVPS
jgi:6-phosphogluconolactonase